jgi:hypothetical protein
MLLTRFASIDPFYSGNVSRAEPAFLFLFGLSSHRAPISPQFEPKCETLDRSEFASIAIEDMGAMQHPARWEMSQRLLRRTS